MGEIYKFFIIDFFFNFQNFHVFLVKVLIITLVDQIRNMHTFYKENSKVEQHSSKVQTLQFFL